jgi:hypothetical protein
MIILSEKDKAFSCLSHQAKLHIELIEARTDYERILAAITYNEPSLVKYYLEAGVSANSVEGSNTSPIFYAAVHKNPLIVKMLLDYGANPNVEHRLTRSTIIGSVFSDYDHLMEHHIDRPIVTEQLHKLVMIAAIMRHAGLRFDTPNSQNESPLDKFGLWVGPERKEQVLAEFLDKINHADINSIRPTDVIARSPEAIIRLSADEEQKIASFRAGRYTEILNDRDFLFSRITVSSRTTLESRVRNYNPRPIDYLGIPISDNSSRIEEIRTGSVFDARRTPLAATEHAENIADMLIVAERYLNSTIMPRFFNFGTMQHFQGTQVHSQQASSSSTNTANNVKKLEDLGFSEENLTPEEQENYRNYCCSISLKIMTNPVFDPRFTQYQFEESEIVRWLRINPVHPFNRERLTVDMLQPNIKLKHEIEQFVESAVMHNSSLKK